MRSQISTRQRIDYDFYMTNENPDDNPFAPPTVQSSLVRDVQQPSSRSLIIYWIIAFCINLPLPVMLGALRTSGPGNIGMIIGCVIVNVTGLWLCRVAPYFMLRLSVGSVPVALSQFFGVLHIFVGLAAIKVSSLIFHSTADPRSGDMTRIGDMARIDEVTLATILTGIGLILPSIAIGYLAGLLFRMPSASRVRRAE